MNDIVAKILGYGLATLLVLGLSVIGIYITAWVFQVDLLQAFWIFLWRG